MSPANSFCQTKFLDCVPFIFFIVNFLSYGHGKTFCLFYENHAGFRLASEIPVLLAGAWQKASLEEEAQQYMLVENFDCKSEIVF